MDYVLAALKGEEIYKGSQYINFQFTCEESLFYRKIMWNGPGKSNLPQVDEVCVACSQEWTDFFKKTQVFLEFLKPEKRMMEEETLW